MLYRKMDSRAIEPTRAHSNDAGMDLYGLEEISIKPGQVVKVATGIQIALNPNEMGLFLGKSGRAVNGLSILGGVIDGGYRGELSVVLVNTNLENSLSAMLALATETNKFILDELIKKAVQDIIKIPYGKACVQLLIIDGIRFPTPKELGLAEWEALGETKRGRSGFGSGSIVVKLHGGDFEGLSSVQVLKPYIYYLGERFKQRSPGSVDYDLISYCD